MDLGSHGMFDGGEDYQRGSCILRIRHYDRPLVYSILKKKKKGDETCQRDGESNFQVYCLVTQLCLALCDPMDCSPLGSSVHGISQATLLKWVAISSSRGSSGLLHCRLTRYQLSHQGTYILFLVFYIDLRLIHCLINFTGKNSLRIYL